MFFRIALPGARRILADHIAWCNRHLPRWNPLSVVGQHMQQAGATPAEAMAFTLASAIQYAEDCIAAGMSPDDFLPRFTFFFDISISFFEEIAKFRAGRRIWARHRARALRRAGSALVALQVPCADLGRRPHARAAAQQRRARRRAGDGRHLRRPAVAAHRRVRRGAVVPDAVRRAHRGGDAEHPARGSASHRRHRSARRLVLRRDADRRDGGAIVAILAEIESAGGMYRAVESGLVQRRIGESAQRFQERVESGEQTVVGVNAYHGRRGAGARVALAEAGSGADAGAPRRVRRVEGAALGRDGRRERWATLARAAQGDGGNIFGAVVARAAAGAPTARSARRCAASSASAIRSSSSSRWTLADRRAGDARDAARRCAAAAIRAGERGAIARAISAIENRAPDARALCAALARRTRPRARRRHHRRAGRGQVDADQRAGARARCRAAARVAVVAIDPSSPLTGGAVLGDRIRMGESGSDPTRCSSARSPRAATCGGVTRTTRRRRRRARCRGLRHRDRRDRGRGPVGRRGRGARRHERRRLPAGPRRRRAGDQGGHPRDRRRAGRQQGRLARRASARRATCATCCGCARRSRALGAGAARRPATHRRGRRRARRRDRAHATRRSRRRLRRRAPVRRAPSAVRRRDCACSPRRDRVHAAQRRARRRRRRPRDVAHDRRRAHLNFNGALPWRRVVRARRRRVRPRLELARRLRRRDRRAHRVPRRGSRRRCAAGARDRGKPREKARRVSGRRYVGRSGGRKLYRDGVRHRPWSTLDSQSAQPRKCARPRLRPVARPLQCRRAPFPANCADSAPAARQSGA